MRTLKSSIAIAALFAIAFSFTAAAQQKAAPQKQPAAPVLKATKNGNVFNVVEKQPQFPGGLKAMATYLGKNVKYPTVDRENNVQGKVFVSFVVEPDGKLTDVQAVRGPSETLKAEAVRVLASSPAWKPGSQGGKKVRVQYTVPVNFVISERG